MNNKIFSLVWLGSAFLTFITLILWLLWLPKLNHILVERFSRANNPEIFDSPFWVGVMCGVIAMVIAIFFLWFLKSFIRIHHKS